MLCSRKTFLKRWAKSVNASMHLMEKYPRCSLLYGLFFNSTFLAFSVTFFFSFYSTYTVSIRIIWLVYENAVKSFAQSKRIIILLMCVSVISKSSLEIWMTFDLVADCKMVMVNFLNNEPLNSYLPSLPTYLFFLF